MELTPSDIDAFWACVKKFPGTDAHWIWTSKTNSKGAGFFVVGTRIIAASRLAWFLEVGPLPERTRLWRNTSICEVQECIRPTHFRPGRPSPGGPGVRKLTRRKVKEIRRRFVDSDEKVDDIAAAYGVSYEMVRKIVRGQAWAEPEDDEAEPAPVSEAPSCCTEDIAPGVVVVRRFGRAAPSNRPDIPHDLILAFDAVVSETTSRLEELAHRAAGALNHTAPNLDEPVLTTGQRCDRAIHLLRDLKRRLDR